MTTWPPEKFTTPPEKISTRHLKKYHFYGKNLNPPEIILTHLKFLTPTPENFSILPIKNFSTPPPEKFSTPPPKK